MPPQTNSPLSSKASLLLDEGILCLGTPTFFKGPAGVSRFCEGYKRGPHPSASIYLLPPTLLLPCAPFSPSAPVLFQCVLYWLTTTIPGKSPSLPFFPKALQGLCRQNNSMKLLFLGRGHRVPASTSAPLPFSKKPGGGCQREERLCAPWSPPRNLTQGRKGAFVSKFGQNRCSCCSWEGERGRSGVQSRRCWQLLGSVPPGQLQPEIKRGSQAIVLLGVGANMDAYPKQGNGSSFQF